MATKTIRLTEGVYTQLKAEQRDDETFSETVERLVGGTSLLDLAGNLTDDQAAEARETVRRSRQEGRRQSRAVVERVVQATEADDGT